MKGRRQDFLGGGGKEEGGAEGTTFVINEEIGTGGGAAGTLFSKTDDVGMRGGGGGRVAEGAGHAEGAGSAIRGQDFTLTIFRIFKMKKY